jgi:exodeoxyribonuclease-3
MRRKCLLLKLKHPIPNPMHIATWNVNSVKSRITHLVQYIRDYAPDVLLLQELKCQTEDFPYMEIEELGYNVAAHGQKSYNGVAILSKYPIEDVITLLPGDANDDQARYIEAVISTSGKALRVASIYVPNGQSPDSEKFPYKLRFFERLHAHIRTLLRHEEILVLGGDYNVAPEAIDVFDPKSLNGTTCFHPEERARFRSLLHLGLTDAYRATNDNTQHFSWWDYRGSGWEHNKGMRIDHLLLSPGAADLLQSSDIMDITRGWEKPSDHAPVVCEIKI